MPSDSNSTLIKCWEYRQIAGEVRGLGGVRGRGTNRAHIGSTLRDPFIDYTKMAAGYGMAGEGPISDPTLLAAALKRGVDSVKRGEPYMIDTITQPR
jgi:thiamine pyrophosphate-dependent acetolactate synthase large subunit-like protein